MISAFPNQQFSPQCQNPVKNAACSSHLLHVIAQITDDLSKAEKQSVFLAMLKGLTRRELAPPTRFPLGTNKARSEVGTRKIRKSVSANGRQEEGAASLKAA
jgi:DNA-directed RNA polymerase specialized sigma24 family protein